MRYARGCEHPLDRDPSIPAMRDKSCDAGMDPHRRGAALPSIPATRDSACDLRVLYSQVSGRPPQFPLRGICPTYHQSPSPAPLDNFAPLLAARMGCIRHNCPEFPRCGRGLASRQSLLPAGILQLPLGGISLATVAKCSASLNPSSPCSVVAPCSAHVPETRQAECSAARPAPGGSNPGRAHVCSVH